MDRSEARRSLTPPRFMGDEHLQKSDVNRGHEPDRHPSPCLAGRGQGEGAVHGKLPRPHNRASRTMNRSGQLFVALATKSCPARDVRFMRESNASAALYW